MFNITLSVEGMMCIRCEEHANREIEKSFKVKSVTSSFKDKKTVIVSENDINDKDLVDAIARAGYKVTSISREEKKKKGFLFFGR